MLTMPDKGISAISYNYLNLPNSLSVSKNGNEDLTINTRYRADGTKVRKENTTVTTGVNGTVTTVYITDYLDGFQYFHSGTLTPVTFERLSDRAMQPQAFSIEGQRTAPPAKTPELQFFPTAEGFYDYVKDQYIYQHRDHLGNTRVSFARNSAGALEITDNNDYYPFGMNHLKTGTAYFGHGSYKNHKYNGKELQETGMYSYGWRDYMPDIARWHGIDQLAESYLSTSTYAYVANNPISNTDPDGRWIYEDGSIGQGPATWDMAGPKYKPYLMMQNYGMSTNYAGNEGGGGGGGTLTIGNITGSAFGFLQDFFLNGNSVNTLFSMIDQLKAIGFKDPFNDEAKFEDALKISGISAIKDLVSILNYVAKQPEGSNIFFEKTNNWLIDGQSKGYKILLNMDNIKNVLELAYIIGHETNHSITSFFSGTFYNTVGSRGPQGQNAFNYFSELISYSWEEKWGNIRMNCNAIDYTYYIHGPNSPVENARRSQAEVDLVNNNLRTLLKLYNNFITIPTK